MRQLIQSSLGILAILSILGELGSVKAFTTTRQPQQRQHLVHRLTQERRSTRWNTSLRVSALPPASGNSNNNNNKINNSNNQPLVRSRLPHQLANGRGTFLGFRNTKDVPGLKSSVEALMPDGGLSPCVIRVLGVGGGGCNAVRTLFGALFGMGVCLCMVYVMWSRT